MNINLEILLSGEHQKDSNQQTEFSDESKILSSLETYAKLKESDNENKKSDPLAASVPLHEPCAVIWDTLHGTEWHIGMTESIIDENSLVIE